MGSEVREITEAGSGLSVVSEDQAGMFWYEETADSFSFVWVDPSEII